jgi:acyl dehydratase
VTLTSPGRTITETDVVEFAGLTGDRHPQHLDAHWSAQSPFGERLAHGMLVLSYAMGLVQFDPERVAAMRRLEEVVFKRPVRIGDTIRVEASVSGTDDGRGLEGYDLRILNQDGRLVARAKVEVLLRRREPETGDDAAPGTAPVLL